MKKKDTRTGRGRSLTQRVIHQVNTINANKVKEGQMVYDKSTGQWAYRDNTGTIQYVPVAGSIVVPSGLEKITEGGNDGYRLVGKSPTFYGDIGEQATDLSESVGVTIFAGAVGDYSFAFGNGTYAEKDYSTAGGLASSATGVAALAVGSTVRAGGEASVSFGKTNDAFGDFTAALGGEGNVIDVSAAHGAIVGGSNNSIGSAGLRSVVLGGDSQAATQPDMVYLPGTKYLSYTTVQISALPDSQLGTIVYDSDLDRHQVLFDDTPAANVWLNLAGLKELKEGANTGHRISDRNPAHHGDIGNHAVDLSYSGTTTSTYGAKGTYSVCLNYQNSVTGQGSIAGGYRSEVSGKYSIAVGQYSKAYGDYSAVFGEGTQAYAAADRSFVCGHYVITNKPYTFGGGHGQPAALFTVDGIGAFGFQHTTSAKSIQGDYCAVLGGTDNDIPNTGDNTVVLGGTGQSGVQANMVYVPALKLQGQATGSLPGSPEAGTLAYDTTVNKLKVWTGAAWETITSV